MSKKCSICNKVILSGKRTRYCKTCASDAYREYAKQYRKVHRAEMYAQYKSVRKENKTLNGD